MAAMTESRWFGPEETTSGDWRRVLVWLKNAKFALG